MKKGKKGKGKKQAKSRPFVINFSKSLIINNQDINYNMIENLANSKQGHYSLKRAASGKENISINSRTTKSSKFAKSAKGKPAPRKKPKSKRHKSKKKGRTLILAASAARKEPKPKRSKRKVTMKRKTYNVVNVGSSCATNLRLIREKSGRVLKQRN